MFCEVRVTETEEQKISQVVRRRYSAEFCGWVCLLLNVVSLGGVWHFSASEGWHTVVVFLPLSTRRNIRSLKVLFKRTRQTRSRRIGPWFTSTWVWLETCNSAPVMSPFLTLQYLIIISSCGCIIIWFAVPVQSPRKPKSILLLIWNSGVLPRFAVPPHFSIPNLFSLGFLDVFWGWVGTICTR